MLSTSVAEGSRSKQISAANSDVQVNNGLGMLEESSEHSVSIDSPDAIIATQPLPSDEALQKQSDVEVAVGNDGLQHTGSNLASRFSDEAAHDAVAATHNDPY